MADLGNLACMYTPTTGTGTVTLSGAVVPSYISFTQAGVVAGNYVTYGIKDGLSREVGRGWISGAGASMTMTRDVRNSTNNNNLLSLTGNAIVYITAINDDYEADVRDWGAKADGVTDDTVAIQAAINNALSRNRVVQLAYGTSIVDGLTIPGNVVIQGHGKTQSILKRKSSASNGFVIKATGQVGFILRDFGIDGNANNNSVVSQNIHLDGCRQWQLLRLASYNAKGGTATQAEKGSGNGIYLYQDTDVTYHQRSFITQCELYNNGRRGIYAMRSGGITVSENNIRTHSSTGISFVDTSWGSDDTPPGPTAETMDYLLITKNYIADCTIGVEVNGFAEPSTTGLGGTHAAPIYGAGYPFSVETIVSENIIINCNMYGISCQANYSVASGNTVRHCGLSGNGSAGMLVIGAHTVMNGNSIRNCGYWGADAGGTNSVISNNVFSDPMLAAGTNGAILLSVGNCQGTLVSGNVFDTGEYPGFQVICLACNGIDGASEGNPTPNKGHDATFTGNKFRVGSNCIGILSHRNHRNPFICDNYLTGLCSIYDFMRIETSANPEIRNNRCVVNEISIPTIWSASTVVIPDECDEFWMAGTAQVNNIVTYSAQSFDGKVRDINMTNFGSGYSSPPSVSFSGGGGSGASAIASVDNGGRVIGVQMINNGSGYTSRPSVSFSGGGGSGATGNAMVGCSNNTGKRLLIWFEDVARVTQYGNILLRGDFIARPTSSCLQLYGMTFPQSPWQGWIELSRGNEASIV